MKAEVLNAIESQLTQLYPEYREKAVALGHHEADWQLCASRIFTEVELLKAYLAATQLQTLEDEELNNLTAWPEISIDYLNFWCCLPYKQEAGCMTLLICDPYALEQHRCFFKQF